MDTNTMVCIGLLIILILYIFSFDTKDHQGFQNQCHNEKEYLMNHKEQRHHKKKCDCQECLCPCIGLTSTGGIFNQCAGNDPFQWDPRNYI